MGRSWPKAGSGMNKVREAAFVHVSFDLNGFGDFFFFKSPATEAIFSLSHELPL